PPLHPLSRPAHRSGRDSPAASSRGPAQIPRSGTRDHSTAGLRRARPLARLHSPVRERRGKRWELHWHPALRSVLDQALPAADRATAAAALRQENRCCALPSPPIAQRTEVPRKQELLYAWPCPASQVVQ